MPQPTIEDCERNNGIDCEREAATELRAEAIQHRGHVIQQMRSMQWREAERISLPRSDEGRRGFAAGDAPLDRAHRRHQACSVSLWLIHQAGYRVASICPKAAREASSKLLSVLAVTGIEMPSAAASCSMSRRSLRMKSTSKLATPVSLPSS